MKEKTTFEDLKEEQAIQEEEIQNPYASKQLDESSLNINATGYSKNMINDSASSLQKSGNQNLLKSGKEVLIKTQDSVKQEMPKKLKDLQYGIKGEGIQSIPAPMGMIIQTFVDDSRYSSGFKMVRSAAKQYDKAKTEKEAAEALGALAAAVVEYLRTRTAKSYTDRKENCEAFLTQLKEFTVYARSEYIDEITAAMEQKQSALVKDKKIDKNNNDYKTYMEELSDLWETKVGARDPEVVSEIKKKTDGTPMMARIKNLQESLETLKTNKIPH